MRAADDTVGRFVRAATTDLVAGDAAFCLF